MGHMDEALSGYTPVTSADLDISLPPMRPRAEPKAPEPAGEPDAGQHGGSAASGDGAKSDDAHGGAGGANGASTAPEPVPQRDDPDDGEHTRSQEEAEPQDVADEDEDEAVTPDDDDGVALDDEPDEATDVQAELAAADQAAAAKAAAEPDLNLHQRLAGIEGKEPATFQKTGFSAGDAETLTVKRFPIALLDRLRLSLAPATGGAFAEALSAPALITAFLVAKTGVELEVDANTAVAVDVFRQVDPRLLAVEQKMDDVMADVGQLASAMKISLNRIAETGTVADGLEFAMAYLIADRVAGLSTADVNESTVDVTQKKALVARDAIRARSKAQRTIERQRDGRRAS